MINDILWEEIKAYCKANNINDVDDLVNKMLRRGFTIEKYGDALSTIKLEPEIKIKEVIKEVPVEVEKEVIVTDDEQINKLTEEIKVQRIKIADLQEATILKDREITRLKAEIERLNSKRDFYGEQ